MIACGLLQHLNRAAEIRSNLGRKFKLLSHNIEEIPLFTKTSPRNGDFLFYNSFLI